MSRCTGIVLVMFWVMSLHSPVHSQEVEALLDRDIDVLSVTTASTEIDNRGFVTVASLPTGNSISPEAAIREISIEPNIDFTEEPFDLDSTRFFQQRNDSVVEANSLSPLKAKSAQNGILVASLQMLAIVGIVGALIIGGVFFRNVSIERSELRREHWG